MEENEINKQILEKIKKETKKNENQTMRIISNTTHHKTTCRSAHIMQKRNAQRIREKKMNVFRKHTCTHYDSWDMLDAQKRKTNRQYYRYYDYFSSIFVFFFIKENRSTATTHLKYCISFELLKLILIKSTCLHKNLMEKPANLKLKDFFFFYYSWAIDESRAIKSMRTKSMREKRIDSVF